MNHHFFKIFFFFLPPHLSASSGAQRQVVSMMHNAIYHEMTDWGVYLQVSLESAVLAAEIKGHVLQGLRGSDACRVKEILM